MFEEQEDAVARILTDAFSNTEKRRTSIPRPQNFAPLPYTTIFLLYPSDM